MMVIEVLGFALSSGDALIRTYFAVEQRFQARRDLPTLLHESRLRVHRICGSIDRYSIGVNEDAIPGNVLRQAWAEFDEIRCELESMLDKHANSRKWQRHLHLPRHVDQIRSTNEKLRLLEHHLGIFGVMTHENMSLREQMRHVIAEVQKIAASQDAEIAKVVRNIDTAMNSNDSPDDTNTSSNGYDDVDVLPGQAKELLNALSKSGLSKDKKLELVKKARKVWEGWKVNHKDMEFARKSNGDRRRIGKGGAAEVYLAHIKLRDEHGNLIPGDPMPVAVKQFVFNSADASEQFAQFIREVFLQKDADHPCIVRTLGGYWPDAGDIEGGDDIEPFIVMERMTHTLRQVQTKKILSTLEAKRRVLADIAAGIEHLHKRRIVHRDIKPENVLLRVADGKIVGRAKVSDFSVSRKTQSTEMMTTTKITSTGLAGTLAYMPPEAFSNSARKASMTARDIWSFGVLMCEVLMPDFLNDLVKEHPEGLAAIAGGGGFARKVAESAEKISCNQVLKEVAVSCLSLDPKQRPRIEDVYELLVNDVPKYSFHFINYLSWEYRANEVLRYIRRCFAVEAQITEAVAFLENAIREKADLAAQNVLAYCHHFGIGVEKDEKKSMELFQRGCDAQDPMAMFAEGVANFSAQRFDAAVPLLTKAADLGCSGAMVWLASCYRYGYGVEKNEIRAFQLTSSSARAGNKDAQAWLASYFRVGIGTEKDVPKAIAMLYGLSASGNGFAAMWLALWYKKGLGVPMDAEKSNDFLLLARKRGIVGSWVFNQGKNWWVIAGK